MPFLGLGQKRQGPHEKAREEVRFWKSQLDRCVEEKNQWVQKYAASTRQNDILRAELFLLQQDAVRLRSQLTASCSRPLTTSSKAEPEDVLTESVNSEFTPAVKRFQSPAQDVARLKNLSPDILISVKRQLVEVHAQNMKLTEEAEQLRNQAQFLQSTADAYQNEANLLRDKLMTQHGINDETADETVKVLAELGRLQQANALLTRDLSLKDGMIQILQQELTDLRDRQLATPRLTQGSPGGTRHFTDSPLCNESSLAGYMSRGSGFSRGRYTVYSNASSIEVDMTDNPVAEAVWPSRQGDDQQGAQDEAHAVVTAATGDVACDVSAAESLLPRATSAGQLLDPELLVSGSLAAQSLGHEPDEPLLPQSSSQSCESHSNSKADVEATGLLPAQPTHDLKRQHQAPSKCEAPPTLASESDPPTCGPTLASESDPPTCGSTLASESDPPQYRSGSTQTSPAMSRVQPDVLPQLPHSAQPDNSATEQPTHQQEELPLPATRLTQYAAAKSALHRSTSPVFYTPEARPDSRSARQADGEMQLHCAGVNGGPCAAPQVGALAAAEGAAAEAGAVCEALLPGTLREQAASLAAAEDESSCPPAAGMADQDAVVQLRLRSCPAAKSDPDNPNFSPDVIEASSHVSADVAVTGPVSAASVDHGSVEAATDKDVGLKPGGAREPSRIAQMRLVFEERQGQLSAGAWGNK